MDKIVKTFVSEIKSIDEKNFTLEAVVSDETIDRYGEVIKVDSWKKRLGRYKASPVLITSHNYDKLTNQIGKAEKVYISDGKLMCKFKYFINEGNEEADWGWKLASKFGMAAYSVGFLPYEYEDKEYDEDVKKGKKPCRIFTDVELLEVSQVLIPANPSAMAKSMESEKDEVVKEYMGIVSRSFDEFIPEEFVELISEDMNAKDEEIKLTIEEEEMKEVLDAIVELKETINSMNEKIIELKKFVDEIELDEEKKPKKPCGKEVEEEEVIVVKEISDEDENYIKKILEDMSSEIDKGNKILSVQS
jgi:hypothetical protein